MAKRLYTTFQNMSRVFDGAWNASDGIADISKSSHPEDVVYKTEDPEKYKEKMLELQQNKYLHNRWIRSNQSLSMSAFAGLSNLKLMYRDADLMDAYPEIGAALDICSEESTLLSGSRSGMVVNVSSKSDRIKSILEDLFVNRLNLQVTAQMVMRSMLKYGNQFMLLDIDKNLGIKGWRQLPVGEVERMENGIINPYGGQGTVGLVGGNTKDADMSTKFVWTSEAGGDLVPFRNWQIAHFRLLHNSMFLPYGCSILLAARRHFRMLALMEDMMLIYRLERSMERRVYKIFVGSLDDDDIPAYVEQIADQFKRTPIVDPLTGQLDLRKNILPVWKKTPIPLLDGRTITIEELAGEFEDGKANYVYSVQDNTHKIVAGKVVWCGKNYTAEQMYKITLDDGSYMSMAGEHEIIMRDGSKKRADEVIVGESVMPFYRKNETNEACFEKVYNPCSDRYEYTNNLISDSISDFSVDVVEDLETSDEYVECLRKNHKINAIEIIDGDDVYCMTVTGDNGEDDRHNFAIRTYNSLGQINDSGCFLSNCASDDIFIPTRNENMSNPIETLSGAKNLDAIDDIKYIQRKVCAALRIPQSFLNFEESQGDGKALALTDVRFARTINRYQQSFLMELTKVATIHLYLLGFEDDLTNFNLTMNNPSTQSEQLELENLSKRVNVVRDAVTDPGNGIPVMSLQRALKEIMKWSDKDIKENFDEIRLEKALAAEYEKTSQIIKRTGVFDTVDRIYGEPGAEYQDGQDGSDMGGEGPSGGVGGFGGGLGEIGSSPGGLDGFGTPEGNEDMTMNGEESSEPTENVNMPMENLKNKKPLITETGRSRRANQIFNKLMENIDSKKKEDDTPTRVDVYDKSLMISEEFNSMFNKLNEFKKETSDN